MLKFPPQPRPHSNEDLAGLGLRALLAGWLLDEFWLVNPSPLGRRRQGPWTHLKDAR